jgi:choline dehydrogenase
MNQEFDYIVVGAGSAGGLLAEKLSRSGKHTVLVLEGGGTNKKLLVEMPAGWGKMLYDKNYSWGNESEPEEWAGGRRLKLPRGKVLGGSSSINGLLYVRGHKLDYQDWVDAGCPGWGWEDMLPHFTQTEDQKVLKNKFHGTGGALTAAAQPFAHTTSAAMVKAAIEAGHKPTDDFNNGEPDGAGYWQVNIEHGKRSSVAVRAITPAMKRSNFTVKTSALVHKVLIENKRAVGVQYQVGGGAVQVAKAKREVLVCAGAFNSPQVLMLSGIGPAEHLKEMGITVVQDAPGVGQNLQDHVTVPMCWTVKEKPQSLNASFRGLAALGPVFEYLFKKKGPLTIPATDFACYFKSSPDQRMNDIQVFGTPISGDAYAMEADGKEGIEPDAVPGLTMGACQVRPHSRGWIKLRSANPADHVRIQMNYLQDERDRTAFLNAMRKLRTIAEQPALAGIIQEESRPGKAVQTDEQLLEWTKKYITSVHHAVGTVKMGAADDVMAPLTPDLKVKVIAGLRVVDASIMPNLPSGNTNAPAVAIASKAADMILADAAK